MSIKVLLVDDDMDLLAVFAEALAEFDYVVLTAPGAPEALLRLETEEVDIVITDVVMPAMSGLRLLELITAAHPTLPVIIISGFLTDQITKDALERGARAVLEKPISPEEMSHAITRALAAPAGGDVPLPA